MPPSSRISVFLLLLYAHPDQASGRFWERVDETLLGVGVACVLGVGVPTLRERRNQSRTSPVRGTRMTSPRPRPPWPRP
jgi:hypothetical protein